MKNDNQNNLIESIKKYSSFWKVFLFSILLCCILCGTYVRYRKLVYTTEAKIKVLDKKEGLNLPSVGNLFSDSRINIENEIEAIKSYPILEKVTNKLNLCYNFFKVGEVKSRRICSFPFNFISLDKDPNINHRSYNLSVDSKNLYVLDIDNDSVYVFKTTLLSILNILCPLKLQFLTHLK